MLGIYATTRHVSFDGGRVSLLGASDCVVGAMTLVAFDGGPKLLVDAGRPFARNWQLPDAALEADALILTHGHTDHISAIGDLLDSGWSGKIFGTHATLELARLNLRDGARLNGVRQADLSRWLRAFSDLRVTVPYKAVTEVARETTIRLEDAGHIIGSASVLVDYRGGASRVLVSGDLGRPNTPLLRDPNTEWDGLPIDVVVLESTYGERNHRAGFDAVRDNLRDGIRHALRDGGHILIPAFAIGRTQTILSLLNDLVENDEIPDLPVAVDSPMALRVTELYQNSRDWFDDEARTQIIHGDDPLDFEHLYAVNRHRDSVRLRDVEESMVIIAGSGMCTGGRIVGHLKELLPKAETCVMFVGYQAPGTVGRAIQEAGFNDLVEIDGEEIACRAERTTLHGLSAHAGQAELVDWFTTLAEQCPISHVVLHHGDPEAQATLSSILEDRFKT